MTGLDDEGLKRDYIVETAYDACSSLGNFANIVVLGLASTASRPVETGFVLTTASESSIFLDSCRFSNLSLLNCYVLLTFISSYSPQMHQIRAMFPNLQLRILISSIAVASCLV